MSSLVRFSSALALLHVFAACAPADEGDGATAGTANAGPGEGSGLVSGGGGTGGGTGVPDTGTPTFVFSEDCGDGVLNGTELCDDGNNAGADGCTAACQIEADYECPTPGQLCISLAVCGNGKLTSNEACDDGNVTGGDGCSADCLAVDPGWQCRMPGRACIPLCGDSVVTPPENCDDGDTDNLDGCSSTCLKEPGWSCDGAPSVCTEAVCGNGEPETGETCDAAGANGLFFGDASGCSKTCTREPSCRDAAGNTVRCATVCGDGNIDESEGCDDGNLVPRDGCSETCQIEAGFSCQPFTQSDTANCSSGSGDCLILPITYRDFDGSYVSGTGHPDFFFLGDGDTICVPNASGVPTDRVNAGELNDTGCWSSDATPLCRGLAAATLGPNGKPTVGAGDLKCACRFTDWDSTGLATDTDEQCWSGTASPYFIDTEVKVIDSAGSFAQWYTDVPSVNQTVVQLLELASSGGNQYTFTSSDGETVYDDIHDAFEDGGGELDSGFFPLDGQTGVGAAKLCNLWPYWKVSATAACETGGEVGTQWDPQANAGEGTTVGNIDGVRHNFYFTSEVRYLFKFEGGEELSFFGDDDVWVFINGKLVLDLGAPHERLRGTVSLDGTGASADYEIEAMNNATNRPIAVGDGTVQGLGLEVGGTYEIAVFHADRHPRESNYELTLSGFSTTQSQCTPQCGDGVIATGEECDDGALNSDTTYGGCRSDCKFGPFCGDGVLDAGNEACDLGRANVGIYGDLSSCSPGCVLPHFCGDGFIDSANGEECDDSGGSANCTANCRLQVL